MEWKLFADLAEAAGERQVALDADPATVGDALDALLDGRDALRARVLDDDGDLHAHVNVLQNGRPPEDGLETAVAAGDELALFPPVSGG